MERRQKRDVNQKKKKEKKGNYVFFILHRYRFRIYRNSLVEEKYKM